MSFSHAINPNTSLLTKNQPFRIPSSIYPRPNETNQNDMTHLQLLETMRLEFRVFPTPGKQQQQQNTTHITDPNTTITNIKTVMIAITQSLPHITIFSAKGNESFDHTMATYPQGTAATSFFNIDRSELSARGYGHVSGFFKAGPTQNTGPGTTILEASQQKQSHLSNNLRNTKSSLRTHIFDTYDTITIGPLLYRHPGITHRLATAGHIREALNNFAQQVSEEPVDIPPFEIIQRELTFNGQNQQSTKLKSLQFLCDKTHANTLSDMLIHGEIDISLGKFIPFGDSPEYHQMIQGHVEYINLLSQFHVTGLHPDVLKHEIADDNNPPNIQNIRNILTQFPYTENHTIILDEVHTGGLSGRWVLSAPTETLLQAIEHTTYILLNFGTQAPTYQHHVSNTAGFSQGIEIQRAPPSESHHSNHPHTENNVHNQSEDTKQQPSKPHSVFTRQKQTTQNTQHSGSNTPGTANSTEHSHGTHTTYTGQRVSSQTNPEKPVVTTINTPVGYVFTPPPPSPYVPTTPYNQAPNHPTTHTSHYTQRQSILPKQAYHPSIQITIDPEHPLSATTMTQESVTSSSPSTISYTQPDMLSQRPSTIKNSTTEILKLHNEVASMKNELSQTTQAHRIAISAMTDLLEEASQTLELAREEHKQGEQKLRDRANQATAACTVHQNHSKKQAEHITKLKDQLAESTEEVTILQTQYKTLQDVHDTVTHKYQQEQEAATNEFQRVYTSLLESQTETRTLQKLLYPDDEDPDEQNTKTKEAQQKYGSKPPPVTRTKNKPTPKTTGKIGKTKVVKPPAKARPAKQGTIPVNAWANQKTADAQTDKSQQTTAEPARAKRSAPTNTKKDNTTNTKKDTTSTNRRSTVKPPIEIDSDCIPYESDDSDETEEPKPKKPNIR
jgi:hypothetical protein